MKLTTALNHKGNPYWIPDCSRDDLPAFFKQLGLTKGVEVGVQLGHNLQTYCKAGLTIYGVDPWVRVPGNFARAKARLAPYRNCTLVRKNSMDALADFPKRSLDFVYIDADHSFGHVANDLMHWTQKVKRGGFVAGHDYYCPAGDRNNRMVRFVVDSFTASHDITNWYVLGRKEPRQGERADDTFSFMFIKHW